MKIILISGKAQSGKTTTAFMIKDYNNTLGLKTVPTSYAKYIKMYARDVTPWDGKEETKPRKVLQEFGGLIRDYLKDENFFVRRLDEDIAFYRLFVDTTVIDDARLPNEIDYFKRKYPNDVKTIHIIRPTFDSGLSPNEQSHITEQGLDNYVDYDYTIVNDGTLDDLKDKVHNLMKEMR